MVQNKNVYVILSPEIFLSIFQVYEKHMYTAINGYYIQQSPKGLANIAT